MSNNTLTIKDDLGLMDVLMELDTGPELMCVGYRKKTQVQAQASILEAFIIII